MKLLNLTLNDRERFAYIEGRTEEAAMLAEIMQQQESLCEVDDREYEIELLNDQIDDLNAEIDDLNVEIEDLRDQLDEISR